MTLAFARRRGGGGRAVAAASAALAARHRPAARLLLLRARRLSSSSSSSSWDGDSAEGVAVRAGLRSLLEAYQRYGHYEASLDPLGLAPIDRRPELDPSFHLPPSLLHTPAPLLPPGGEDDADSSAAAITTTAAEYAAWLRATYCGTVGFEFSHLDDAGARAWLTRRVHGLFGDGGGGGGGGGQLLSPAERVRAASLMLRAEAFERFLARKFPSFKRYSGEGAEAMQPAVDAVLRAAWAGGTEAVVIGMPHRGRLALLAAQLEYPVRRMLHKVAGKSEFPSELAGVVDDVTSHLHASVDKDYGADGSPEQGGQQRRPLHVSLLHNPSHLEIIGCVAAGKARAKRTDGSPSLCLQIHGDAALSGQGCIQETLALSRLRGFEVGGTVHLVVNNQVGFTIAQHEADGLGRSSRYCTDAAKAVQAPVFHVNGADVDAALRCCRLAVEYRARFGGDVFVDLHAYRLHGHNEVDEPAFTQPVMYHAVRDPARPTPAAAYIQQLVREGLMTQTRGETLRQQFDTHLEAEAAAALDYDIALPAHAPDAFKGKWRRMRHPDAAALQAPVATGVPLDVLRHVGAASVALPEEAFRIHPRLAKGFVQARLQALEKGVVDWATAEALAVGSLLAQGFDVRLCGQDVGRGTFSQRHFLLTDQATGATYCPLAHVVGSTGRLEVVNSNLSELAVLGFEYGHSIEEPMRLGIWEAQFGDFANGAQIVIDTFISGGEAKWLRQSGLILLLPHGMDGAGPEHSSGRLERFLQLSQDMATTQEKDEDDGGGGGSGAGGSSNLIVQNLTTPAQYFHALRRQLLRTFRKPLVLMAPKTLLRHPKAVSPLEAMGIGQAFQPVLASTLAGEPWPASPLSDAARLRGVVFCSGKMFYDVTKATPPGIDPASVLVVRLEELAPFPRPALAKLLRESLPSPSPSPSSPTPPRLSFLWAQEEPRNAGAWAHVKPHLEALLRDDLGLAPERPPLVDYVGRPPLPTPAVGLGEAHRRQGEAVMAALWAKLGGK